MNLQVRGPLIHWRGPSPFHFIPMPARQSAKVKALAPQLTYGWGVIPVRVTIGGTTFTTSLFPKDGIYLVPIKHAVRSAEKLALGMEVEAVLEFDQAK